MLCNCCVDEHVRHSAPMTSVILANMDVPPFALPPPPPPPAGGTLVALDSCSFAYVPDEPAALSVTLAIQSGMRVLVDGVTGAGKSLLLRALAGRLRPCTGTRSTGRFVQLLYWDDSLRTSDLEDVETPLEFVVRLGGGDDAACAEVLSSIGIDHFAARRPCSSLSSGERTLLTIAALAVAPKHLLLLDEPAAFLGRAAIDTLAEALAPERWPGALVFASSSPHLREALRPTHVAIVHGGRVELHECPRLHHHLPAVGSSGGMASVMTGAPPLGTTGAAPAVGGTREPPLGGGGDDDDDMLWDADELLTARRAPPDLNTVAAAPKWLHETIESGLMAAVHPKHLDGTAAGASVGMGDVPGARAVPSASSAGMGGLTWLNSTDSMAATMAMSMAMMREMGMAQDEAFSAMQTGAAALRSVLAADRAISGRPRSAQEGEDEDEAGMRLEASPAPAARADGSHYGDHDGAHAFQAGVDVMGVEGHGQLTKRQVRTWDDRS